MQLKEEIVSLDPVLSSLPFQLKGTIIHANPNRSVATIKAGSDHKIKSYTRGENIAEQAEIKEIQRKKVIFLNLNNNRLEYIIIPEEKEPFKLSYLQDKLPLPQTSSTVRKKGLSNFEINRSDINEYLHNLPEILQQARVVPHPDGFEFTHIDKTSIFNELGFKKGDVIKEVDGEIVRTPEQALELFDRLKGEDRVEILVQKDGKDIRYNYTIRNNAPTI